MRQIFDIDIELVQTSCGYGVPLMAYQGDRPRMKEWTDNQLRAGKLESYIARNSSPLPEKLRMRNAGADM